MPAIWLYHYTGRIRWRRRVISVEISNTDRALVEGLVKGVSIEELSARLGLSDAQVHWRLQGLLGILAGR
ncbi:hypothetical protein DRB17_06445 [Ferruginivarius sediminum]|uniref:HTH luxR-type domain-containing protein n=1 Tax=Ferruginivarius sediminum TaxID=2661937 RepID=A0A369TBV2_9PROT|nr:hypothetical protein DRB17_06445 [Ferruginivarius sediminum]